VDISIVGKDSIRLKGRKVTFIVDPVKDMPKTSADAVILLNSASGEDLSKAADYRIIIKGAGEYEVGGSKVSGVSTQKGVLYKLSIDDISIILGSPAETKAENFTTCQIAVIKSDEELSDSFVTALEPKITIVYGEKKAEAAKSLGSENTTSVSKLTITKDKLPEKMEIVVLE